jgi:dTDP-4-dehydrorhamnose 3,5-epimerase-like enzyme
MPVKIDRLTVHEDARGVVFEPLAPDLIPAQRNVHVVTSGPGIVRGNHRHLKGTEIIAVAGPALVRIREDGKLRDIEVPNRQVCRFILPPRVSHAIKNIGDRPNVLVAFNTCEHDPQHPDTVPDTLIENDVSNRLAESERFL